MFTISVVLTLMVGGIEKDYSIFNPNLLFTEKYKCEIFVKLYKDQLIQSRYTAFKESNIKLIKVSNIECLDPAKQTELI